MTINIGHEIHKRTYEAYSPAGSIIAHGGFFFDYVSWTQDVFESLSSGIGRNGRTYAACFGLTSLLFRVLGVDSSEIVGGKWLTLQSHAPRGPIAFLSQVNKDLWSIAPPLVSILFFRVGLELLFLRRIRLIIFDINTRFSGTKSRSCRITDWFQLSDQTAITSVFEFHVNSRKKNPSPFS